MNIYRKILYILPLAALLTLVGCGPSGDSFRLKGSVSGMETGEIYIYNTSNDNARFDTIRIENGAFFYIGEIEETTPFTIVYPNAIEQVVFIGPGDEIEYEVVTNSLNDYKVSGSGENKLMTKFRTEIQNASAPEVQAKARKFIGENTKSAVALYIYDHYFVQNPQTTYKELNEILETLRHDNTENIYFKKLEAKVKAMKTINVGESFPNLKLNGKHSSTQLWSRTADHTVFLCWATWVPTSYEFLAKIRQESSTHPGGDLRFVALSIDSEYDRWDNMVRYDSLTTIEHYIDTKAFESPILKQIGTSHVPTYFILDSSHKVVSKGDNPQQLDADINKYSY